jgi:O-antigen ligase
MNIHISKLLFENRIYLILFQLCVIANAVFGEDKEAFFVSKVFMLLFFVGITFKLLASGTRIVLGKSVILPFILVFYEIISCVWAFNQEVAISQLVTQLQLFVLFFFSYMYIKQIGRLEDYYNAMYLSGIGLIFYSLYVYGGLSSFLAIMSTGHRMGDLIGNQNTYGLVFANAALVALYYFFFNNEKRYILLAGLFIFFGLSSGSKKVVFLLILGLFFLILSKYGVRKLFKVIVYSFTSVLVGLGIIHLPLFSTILERLESYLSVTGNTSDNLRAELIRYGLDLFYENPLLGYGLNNYSLFHWSGTYSHNNYIEILVSLGIMGFLIYYSIFINSTIALLKKRKNLKSIHALLVFSIISSLIFGYGMVQFYSKGIWILMGVMLAEVDNIAIVSNINKVLCRRKEC